MQAAARESQAPPPDYIENLTAAFTNLSIPPTTQNPSFPTEPYAISHLKLLHAFSALKEEVGFTDGLFGIFDSQASGEGVVKNDVQVDRMSIQQGQSLAMIREKRWALYVARATERFAVYWTKILCKTGSGRLQQMDMLQGSFEAFPQIGKPIYWTRDMLPPLGKTVFSIQFQY